MLIIQEKEFKPVTITIETEEEYSAFARIIYEAHNTPRGDRAFMEAKSAEMVMVIRDWLLVNLKQ